MAQHFNKVRGLGLALIAALALGAASAPVASAQIEFEWLETKVTVGSVSEQQVFKYKEGAPPVKCKIGGEYLFFGSKTTGLRFDAEYYGCEKIFGLEVVVDVNSCYHTYTLGAGVQTEESFDVACETPGDSITVTVGPEPAATPPYFCAYHVYPQEIASITYANMGTGGTREVKITPDVEAISATRTGSIFCGPATSGTASLKGSFSLTGESPDTGAHRGIFVP